jgi:hypothetical protein
VTAEIINPLNRVPVSLIIDDSCPVLNLTRPWIQQCWAKAPNHQGQTPKIPWPELPAEIPADFARKFADWAGENGVKGKFSVVPMPAGLGRIDESLPGVPPERLAEWMEIIRERIRPNWDLTPEMITHTFVVDLKTWRMSDEVMEQYNFTRGKSADELTEYQAAALQILKNVGIEAEGVTSPGGYGNGALEAYAEATGRAAKAVLGQKVTYFFKEVFAEPQPPAIPVLDRDAGEAVVSIIANGGDWFGGWTGWDLGHANLCITENLRSGRMVAWINAGQPAVNVSHWPGFYFNGTEAGFEVCKTVVDRLNRLPNILWMKPSEIARYWAVKALARVEKSEARSQESEGRASEEVVIESPQACPGFTLRLRGARGVPHVNGQPLREANGPLSLTAGTYASDGTDTLLAFDLPAGRTVVMAGSVAGY